MVHRISRGSNAPGFPNPRKPYASAATRSDKSDRVQFEEKRPKRGALTEKFSNDLLSHWKTLDSISRGLQQGKPCNEKGTVYAKKSVTKKNVKKTVHEDSKKSEQEKRK